jgi:hypothetical protein
MQNSPAQLADKIVKIYQPWQQCNALQIDLDAPESKLGYYRSLMLELRKRLPGTRLSITVLPCHIKHTAEFYRLAAVCDYYVLQVHGLDKSRGKWFILDGDIAADAIKRAEKLAFPYQAALPLYCHRIKGGKLVQPDLALTAGLAQQTGGKVIGFRLGVPGEREALTMQSAMEICHGRHAPELKFQWQHQPNGAWFLLLTNRGFFPQRVECSFTLPENVRISDMDSFGAARLDYTAKKFTFELPPDGATQNILWLRIDKNVDLSQHNNFTIKMKEL